MTAIGLFINFLVRLRRGGESDEILRFPSGGGGEQGSCFQIYYLYGKTICGKMVNSDALAGGNWGRASTQA
jgi:hypothetical protein